MKRLLSILMLIATLSTALTSCSKDDKKVTLDFAKSVYVMLADAPVEVTLKASSAVADNVAIPIVCNGSAIEGDEYTISSKSFNFVSGSTTASITITPKDNITSGKDIVITLGNIPGGYTLGNQSKTVVSLEAKESLIYSFNTDKSDVLDRYKITLTLSGVTSGKNFTATNDIEIPFVINSKSTAISGTNFEIEGGAKSFIVKAGSNSATIFIKSLTVDPSSDAKTAILEIDRNNLSKRFIKGDISEITLTIKGVLKASSLVGKYEYVGIPGLDELKLFAEEMEDDPELLPYKNVGYTFEIIANEDDTYTLKPGTKDGDLSAFLRESKFDYSVIFHPIFKSEALSEYTSLEPYMWTSEKKTLTYFKLERVNRAFSKTVESIGEATIAFAIDGDGNLELHLRDYEKPPFLNNWWDPEKWDSDMFGFCYTFKKL